MMGKEAGKGKAVAGAEERVSEIKLKEGLEGHCAQREIVAGCAQSASSPLAVSAAAAEWASMQSPIVPLAAAPLMSRYGFDTILATRSLPSFSASLSHSEERRA